MLLPSEALAEQSIQYNGWFLLPIKFHHIPENDCLYSLWQWRSNIIKIRWYTPSCNSYRCESMKWHRTVIWEIIELNYPLWQRLFHEEGRKEEANETHKVTWSKRDEVVWKTARTMQCLTGTFMLILYLMQIFTKPRYSDWRRLRCG